jgi:hypothetical protein
MNKVSRIIRQYLHKVRWLCIKLGWLFVSLPKKSNSATDNTFTLGITTYKERYESYLKPLVKKLVYLFPETPIIIAVNGYHNQTEQEKYLLQISNWVKDFKNVSLITYKAPQGLCTLWNQILIKSISRKVFLMNEDIDISLNFKRDLMECGILDVEFGLINGSFSHYMLNKSILKKVGWFDERFPGIGYEDHDYEIRMTIAGKKIEHYQVKGIKNETVVPKDWSYDKEHEVILTKYSEPNEKHYFSKWKFADTKQNGYTYVRIIQGYAKQIEGMETPNFYPEITFD